MTVCNTIERMSQFGFARTMDRFVSIRGNLPKWLVSGRRPAHTLPKKQPTDDRYFPLAELSLEGNPLEPPVLASISHALQQLSFREAGKGSVGGVGQEGVSSSLKILLDQNGWLLRGPLNTSFSRDSLVTRHTHTHTRVVARAHFDTLKGNRAWICSEELVGCSGPGSHEHVKLQIEWNPTYSS